MFLFKRSGLRKTHSRLQLLCLTIGISFLFNILFITHFLQYSFLSESHHSLIYTESEDLNHDIISTIERSRQALDKLKQLLSSVIAPHDHPWIWISTPKFPSVPYQPPSPLNHRIPKPLYNLTTLPKSVLNEITRVCERLKQADEIGGEIWCKLFNNSYSDTLASTTTILDDNSTYIITGDIDLMWLRDSR